MGRVLRLLLAVVAQGLRALAGRLTPVEAVSIPAPDPVAEADAESASGPPDHWLAMVRVRAPGLHLSLRERGVITPQRRSSAAATSMRLSIESPSRAPTMPPTPPRRAPEPTASSASASPHATVAPQRHTSGEWTSEAAYPRAQFHCDGDGQTRMESSVAARSGERPIDASPQAATTDTATPFGADPTVSTQTRLDDLPPSLARHSGNAHTTPAPVHHGVGADGMALAPAEEMARPIPPRAGAVLPYLWTPSPIAGEGSRVIATHASAGPAASMVRDAVLPVPPVRWSASAAEPHDGGGFPRLPDESPHRSVTGRAAVTAPPALRTVGHRPAPIIEFPHIEEDGAWPVRHVCTEMPLPVSDRWPALPADDADTVADDLAAPDGHRERLADEQRGVAWNG